MRAFLHLWAFPVIYALLDDFMRLLALLMVAVSQREGAIHASALSSQRIGAFGRLNGCGMVHQKPRL